MKQFRILLIYLIFGCFILTGCGKQDLPTTPETDVESVEPSKDVEIEIVDHAGSVKLNMNSSTIKQEVTVKTFVDGDTTHFNVPESVMPD